MELKEFIKIAIREISEAIVESNKELTSTGTMVNPKNVYPVTADARDNLYGHLLKEVQKQGYRRPVYQVIFDIAVSSTVRKDGKRRDRS